jgi:hypothetical protein
MNPRCLILLLLLSPLPIKAQTFSSCKASPVLVEAYKTDALDMAIERMYSLRTADTALIHVPTNYIDSAMSLIAVVCNLSTQYQADSIFNNYCVHRWGYVGSTIMVSLDTSYAWTRQWLALDSNSGNLALDQFMRTHNYGLSRTYPVNKQVRLTRRSFTNSQAFADSLKRFPGVLDAFLMSSFGDGSRIRFSADTAWHMEFDAGWGDCFSGCIEHKIWKYTINLAQCTVSLDTIKNLYDQTIAAFSSCNLNAATKVQAVKPRPGLMIYPNPAVNNVKLAGLPGTTYTYNIQDATGRTLISGISRDNTIDVSTLITGYYTLLITDPGYGILAEPFIKK